MKRSILPRLSAFIVKSLAIFEWIAASDETFRLRASGLSQGHAAYRSLMSATCCRKFKKIFDDHRYNHPDGRGSDMPVQSICKLDC